MTLTASGATSYTWSPVNGLDGADGAIVSAKPMVSKKYTVTGATDAGCKNAATVMVTVKPIPLMPTVSVAGTTLTSSASTGNQWYLNGSPLPGDTSKDITLSQYGSYTVCVTGADTCQSCSEPFSFGGISKESNAFPLELYPNPTSGTFTIHLPQNSSNAILNIYSSIGTYIYTASLQTKISEIPFLQPPGSYLIQVHTDQGVYVSKLMVK